MPTFDFVYCTRYSQRRRRSLVAGTTGAAISNVHAQLKRFALSLAADVDEQRAIAACLADADAEIDALERRVSPRREAIKQGMMQELLTGRTRLPSRRPHA